jgi:pyrroloquinoline quinone biosynthesis protein B
MILKILGSAARGGFPQWNCACPNCEGLRSRKLPAKPRTQSQLAFSPLDGVWFLIGASPDLRSQILAAPELTPTPDAPSPIAGFFLPSADLEMVEGLLQLIDSGNSFMFATPAVQRILKTENRFFQASNGATARAQWQPLSARRRIGCHLSDNSGDAPTFFYTSVPLGGTYPDYLSEETRRNCPAEEARMGFVLEQAEKKLFVGPRVFGGNSEWLKAAESSDVALLDAAVWRDLLLQFPQHSGSRRILTNIPHESPLLDEKSEEHHAVVEAGFEIAYDGMEVRL